MRNTCRCVGFALRLYLDAIKLQKNMDSLLESERMGTSELRYGKYGPALMRDMFTSRLSEGVGMLEDCGIDLSKVTNLTKGFESNPDSIANDGIMSEFLHSIIDATSFESCGGNQHG